MKGAFAIATTVLLAAAVPYVAAAPMPEEEPMASVPLLTWSAPPGEGEVSTEAPTTTVVSTTILTTLTTRVSTTAGVEEEVTFSLKGGLPTGTDATAGDADCAPTCPPRDIVTTTRAGDASCAPTCQPRTLPRPLHTALAG